ncbi:MAG: glycosyltransferase family 4 protein [Gammaproteobacteria bacterium]
MNRGETPVSATQPAATPEHGSHPRHICIVTDTYPPEVNGVSLTLARLAQGLQGLGHTVSVVCPNPWHGERRSRGPRLTAVSGLPLPGYKGLHFGLPAGGVLRERWAQDRPDVVYVATEGLLGWSAVRTAHGFGIPVLSGFHTDFHSYSRHYYAGLLQHWVAYYLRWFHNRTGGTLVPSTELRERLRAGGFKNVSVLGRGVDSELFTPARRCAALRESWGLSEQDVAVLYVGRVAAEKNLGLAIAAYRAMQASGKPMKFVIVGDGPQLAAFQTDHPDLLFCGVHRGEPLAERYASADVFLFPSETETFGNVTLEAMASGLAVVAYDYAAAHTHITHGETGMLAPYGQPKDYVAAAVELARAPQTLPRMRHQAREYAATLGWPRVVQQFEALLTAALNHRQPAADVLQRPLADLR